MGQTEKKYDSLWKKVEDLSAKKGLTKSALQEVDKIYQLAKKEKNETQVIKALLYNINLGEAYQDNNDQPASIIKLENEKSDFSEPALSILNSILAEQYLHFYQQHRYKLYGRTETTNFKKDDVSTWTIGDFQKKISSLYIESISNKKLLQQTKLEPFDAIIVKGNSRNLRPTLYDLLANRALDYFRSDERDITKPAYAFEIKDSNLFFPAESFVKLSINTADSLSLHHKALQICQELIRFHINDPKPDALVDADITRIEIVHQYAVQDNKEGLYSDALGHIYTKYSIEPAASKAAALLAQWHVNKASRYQPLKDTGNRFEYNQAMDICEKIISQKQESEGKSICLEIINQIKRQEITLQTEQVNIPGLPFRTLVTFRNFTRLYLRVLPVTTGLEKQPNWRNDNDFWKQLVNHTPTRSWSQELPATNDHQLHSTEIKVDALPVGSYILLASVHEDYSLDKNPMALQYFSVSGISYINSGEDYFILDRESGKPLAKATVQLWKNYYVSGPENYKTVKAKEYLTDKNGYFKAVGQKIRQEEYQLEIHYKKDWLFLNDYRYNYNRNENEQGIIKDADEFEEEKRKVFFFTDRSIYRPGQTVFFKGIAITEDFNTRRSKLYPNFKSWVKLFDVNNQLIDSLEVTTNEFGSYSGKFKLPQHGINGEFRLEDMDLNGEISFSVEEYKRPRFYVAYEKLKNTYKVNDSIQLSGYAKAYAGNNIDGASVKYRVIRTSRFIYPWLYWKIGMPRSGNMEITNGNITTDADGKFIITFKAIPDDAVDKTFEPIFDYKIIADITDINGETRSAETTVPVSYKSITLKVNIGNGKRISLDNIKTILISTQNLNNEFVPAIVHLTINKLKTPGKLVRKRYWNQPDQYVLSEEEYATLFPYDEYRDESNPQSWNKEDQVYEHTDSSKINSIFEIPSYKKIAAGWYLFEVTTKDESGKEVKDIQYVELFDENSKTIATSDYTWSAQLNPVTEPGQESSIIIGSAASNLFVIQQVEKKLTYRGPDDISEDDQPSRFSEYSFIAINNEKKTINFPVTENDRGGFDVSHFFVKNNRFYITSNQVTVPWTNKELTISYESFRDQTLPGSDEKWSLKITGSKNEKIAAEVLASMYDASLDQFRPNSWNLPDLWPNFFLNPAWNSSNDFSFAQSQQRYYNNNLGTRFYIQYDALIAPFRQSVIRLRGKSSLDEVVVTGYGVSRKANMAMAAPVQLEGKVAGLSVSSDTTSYSVRQPDISQAQDQNKTTDTHPAQIRKNFNETAFFLPDLKTDSMGNLSFAFTIPEALTTWKFQAMAHTKDASFGYSTKDIITQKQLMVQPNAPRFFREGDHMDLSTKIVNMTDKELTGTVHLELFNASDMTPVDGWFQNMTANQYLTAEAGKSVVANFNIQVPYQFNSAIVYRFTASSDSAKVSDGEEASLPVLTNAMLVTESLPLHIQPNTTRKFKFEKLLQSASSETLQQHSLTVEFSSNPAWYAVQALPYLIEYPYECSEQTFNRFYANALATKITNASPRIKAIFEKWKSTSTEGKETLISNLEKNPELKSALLEETPWVLQAKSESQQKKNIALLFDMVRMNGELSSAIAKLKELQLSNGGFSWFKGGNDDRFITQYILTGIGHLKQLHAIPESLSVTINGLVKPAISYLDKRLQEDYADLVKHKSELNRNQTGYLQVQYFYMRSFFSEYGILGETFTAANYYRKQCQQFWLQQNKYMQGMIALALNRSGDHKTAVDILKSLTQNAIVTPDMGMYWKENIPGYYWYQAPVETQSLLIEAFGEIKNDAKTVDALKTWLLQQKQTQQWSSTKATADACYALLLQGTDWISNDPAVVIKLGDKAVTSAEQQQDAGTGYFKKTFEAPFVNPSMGDIAVTVSSPVKPGVVSTGSSSWGAIYWQYFEQLDKITPSATALHLTKKLFVERNTDRGPVLEPVADGAAVKIGDKIKVRIELRADRDMEYVHMKDMRAGCMEPINVLSSYKYQGGLGYYESTKDASTNFFFNWLPKGVYVFEYPLLVTQTGNFSNGVTSIACMYAPEFSSHSEGIRINVE